MIEQGVAKMTRFSNLGLENLENWTKIQTLRGFCWNFHQAFWGADLIASQGLPASQPSLLASQAFKPASQASQLASQASELAIQPARPWMDRWTYGKYPHSTGLCLLLGLLPYYSPTKTEIQYKAGQGYCWPYDASGRLFRTVGSWFSGNSA